MGRCPHRFDQPIPQLDRDDAVSRLVDFTRKGHDAASVAAAATLPATHATAHAKQLPAVVASVLDYLKDSPLEGRFARPGGGTSFDRVEDHLVLDGIGGAHLGRIDDAEMQTFLNAFVRVVHGNAAMDAFGDARMKQTEECANAGVARVIGAPSSSEAAAAGASMQNRTAAAGMTKPDLFHPEIVGEFGRGYIKRNDGTQLLLTPKVDYELLRTARAAGLLTIITDGAAGGPQQIGGLDTATCVSSRPGLPSDRPDLVGHGQCNHAGYYPYPTDNHAGYTTRIQQIFAEPAP